MNWLEKICNERNISFYQLSKKCGVAQSTLSNIRHKNIGLHDIKLLTALSIAYGLDMSISDLIDKVASYEIN